MTNLQTTPEIKANELRVGNWVYDNGKGVFDRTMGNRRVSHELIYSLACGNTGYIQPITITPEILETIGFKTHPAVPVWQLMLPDYNGDIMFFGTECKFVTDGEKTTLPHIKYLHQLQNLYFALTGEELEINL